MATVYGQVSQQNVVGNKRYNFIQTKQNSFGECHGENIQDGNSRKEQVVEIWGLEKNITRSLDWNNTLEVGHKLHDGIIEDLLNQG